MTDGTANDRPGRLRADARRNREQILAAARALFVEHGIGIPMEEIARRAGVGVGTLYRRFPDREALLHAVAGHTLRQLIGLARAAWEQEPDAWRALVWFVRRSTRLRLGVLYSVLSPGLPAAVRWTPELLGARHSLLELLERMVAGAQAAGLLRRDIGPGDIALLISLDVRHPGNLPGQLAELVPARFVELVVEGLRARSGNRPLPGKPITSADIEPGAAEPRPPGP